ncbi:MAG: hypothetical protein M1836_002014 [Candelina mexicana]|nr:MAG: hypothetical protein M1836_002014 [Candelina mexicana]
MSLNSDVERRSVFRAIRRGIASHEALECFDFPFRPGRPNVFFEGWKLHLTGTVYRPLFHSLGAMYEDPNLRGLHTLYRIEVYPLGGRGTEGSINEILTRCNHRTGGFTSYELTSFGPKSMMETAYRNHVGSNGVLVCADNYKARDKNEPWDQLWPSDVLWKTWSLGSGKPSDLEVICRFGVDHSGTKELIWRVARQLRCTASGPEHHVEYTKKDIGYYILLGTQNGASTMRMLLNNKDELGFRTVDRVVIAGASKVTTLEGPECRDLVFLFPRAVAQITRRRRSSDVRWPITNRVGVVSPAQQLVDGFVPRIVGVVVILPLTTSSEAKSDPAPPRGASGYHSSSE